jgi:hypothetical protein
VRSVPIIQPQTPYPAGPESPPETGPDEGVVDQETARGVASYDEDIFVDVADTTSILANFSLSTREDNFSPTTPGTGGITPDGAMSEGGGFPSHISRAASWPEYINNLGLEIIRTTDFYGLILKGSNINHFFVGGGEDFLLELAKVTRPAIGLEPEKLVLRRGSQDLSSTFEAICIGTGAR